MFRAKHFRYLRIRFRKQYLIKLVMKQTQSEITQELEILKVVWITDNFEKRLYCSLD